VAGFASGRWRSVGIDCQHLSVNGGGPQFGIFLLDLDNDIDKLQVSLDSLLEGNARRSGLWCSPPAKHRRLPPRKTPCTLSGLPANYVDKLNQSAQRQPCDWLLLAEAGDEFTASGLLRASLELMSAGDCRAVAMDEIQRMVTARWRCLPSRPSTSICCKACLG
jgi:hypothetical protein